MIPVMDLHHVMFSCLPDHFMYVFMLLYVFACLGYMLKFNRFTEYWISLCTINDFYIVQDCKQSIMQTGFNVETLKIKCFL